MRLRRVNKFWFVLKFVIFILLTSFSVYFVLSMDSLSEKYCNCAPCNLKTVEITPFLEKITDFFCYCPTCD